MAVTKAKAVRVRRSESQWREVLARLDSRGLSVAGFCDREGISAATVYRWRGLLSAGHSSPQSKTPETPRFVDLGVIADGSKSSDRSRSRVEVRLDLGDALVVHVVRG